MSSFKAVPTEAVEESHEDIFVDVPDKPEIELVGYSSESASAAAAAAAKAAASVSFADRVLAGRPESEALVVNYHFGKYHEVEQPSCCARRCCGRSEYTATKFQSYKYGLPGSDGEFWANYLAYQYNNQEVLAIFFADKLNPLSRWQRFFIFACSATATLFVNALFQGAGANDVESQIAGIIVSIIIQQPVQIFLTQTALMQICEKNNCCVKCAHYIGNLLFICVGLGFLAIFLTIAILEIADKNSDWADQFIRSFFLAIGVSWAKTLALDAPNWYVEDWSKVPIVGYSSLLRTLLNLTLPPLFSETYAESKARFEKNYAIEGHEIKDILQYRDHVCGAASATAAATTTTDATAATTTTTDAVAVAAV